ncbi:hypothetical protein [Isoptericola haloaureus]|uniref:MYXO-CTERM domain-containing protein n=1 Tax=Isoptericola haloaureus TaxID=1542902 RepID=A0ABU7Z384_9MICO
MTTSGACVTRLGVGGPILVWVGLYIAGQILTFASLVAVPVGFVPALLLLGAVCLGWTLHSWKRKVSLV